MAASLLNRPVKSIHRHTLAQNGQVHRHQAKHGSMAVSRPGLSRPMTELEGAPESSARIYSGCIASLFAQETSKQPDMQFRHFLSLITVELIPMHNDPTIDGLKQSHDGIDQ